MCFQAYKESTGAAQRSGPADLAEGFLKTYMDDLLVWTQAIVIFFSVSAKEDTEKLGS